MSSYKNIIVTLLFVVFYSGCSLSTKSISSPSTNQQNIIDISSLEQEDRMILFALEAINQGDYLNAFELFVVLYNTTQKFEYLKKSIDIALLNQEYSVIVDLIEINIEKHLSHKKDLDFTYAVSLLNTNQIDKAIKIADDLIKREKNDKHNILMGNLQLIKQNYHQALLYFEEVYKLQPQNIGLLLVMSEILYDKLNQKQNAIVLLDKYINEYGCNIEICEKIYTYYMEQNDINGMIKTLQKNYVLMASSGKIQEALGTLNIIIEMLKTKDINEALEFVKNLDNSEYKTIKLVELYNIKKDLPNLLIELQKLYDHTKNIDILAQMAMSKYEMTENKNEVLEYVVSKFEKVLLSSSNHMYQNYLGYLLIDHDLDYNKGIELVELALKQEPNNHAYLDSLAWGYYKLGNCDKSYKIMFDIVNEIGTEHEEIRLHWEAIKNCEE